MPGRDCFARRCVLKECKKLIEYRKLRENEIRIELFEKFVRHQVVTDCLRKENDEWVIRSAPFIDDFVKIS